jgi:hypothetical protein
MSEYFLNLARLALGTGSSFSPRQQPEFDEHAEMGEKAPEPVASSGSVSTAIPPPITPITNNEFHRYERQDHHEHLHPAMESVERIERTSREEARVETRLETERVNERREHELQTTWETLREVLRESARIQERSHRETVREVERAVAIPERVLERQRETERLIVEVQDRQTTLRQTEIRERLSSPPAESAAIEVHIGRVEIRAVPGETASTPAAKAKPAGIIDLNDYLRERSRGTS